MIERERTASTFVIWKGCTWETMEQSGFSPPYQSHHHLGLSENDRLLAYCHLPLSRIPRKGEEFRLQVDYPGGREGTPWEEKDKPTVIRSFLTLNVVNHLKVYGQGFGLGQEAEVSFLVYVEPVNPEGREP